MGVLAKILVGLDVQKFRGDIDDVVRELVEELEVLPVDTYSQMAFQAQSAEARAKIVADACAKEIVRIRGIAEREVQAARDLVAESSKKFSTTITHFEHDAEGNISRALTTKPIPFNPQQGKYAS
jgi:hypothetical protein